VTVTLEQLKAAVRPPATEPQPEKYGPYTRDGVESVLYAWGRESAYSKSKFSVPDLLFDALRGYEKNVDGIFKRYATATAARVALEAARIKLYEQIGQLSGRKPYYGSASFTYMWDDGAFPEKFVRDPVSQVPKEWFARLTGNVYGTYCRNYLNEVEAYIDLGRAIVLAGDCAPAAVSQPEEKVKTMEPKTADAVVTTTTATPEKVYTPWPSPSGNGAYWYKNGEAAYGAAALPDELFKHLNSSYSKSPDWAYYHSDADAAKDLALAKESAELSKLEPVHIAGLTSYGAREPFGNYTESYLVDQGCCAWSNDVQAAHRLPRELWDALRGKRGPFNNLRADLVMYPTRLAAALDLRRVLTDLKWEKDAKGLWGPPKLAVNPPFADREPAAPLSGGNVWYWVSPDYVFISPEKLTNKDEARLPVEVMKRLPSVEHRGNGTYIKGYATRDAAVKALNDLSAVIAAEEAAKEAAAKAEALKTGDDRAPAKHPVGSWYWVTASYNWYQRPDGYAACTISEDLLQHMPMTNNSGLHIRGYKTQEEAVKAYKDAKAAKAELDKQTASAQFVQGKAPFPINQGPRAWYWATSADDLYWTGGTTEGLETGMVTAEMFAALKTEQHGSLGKTWIAYKTQEEACAAYLAAAQKIRVNQEKAPETKAASKYAAQHWDLGFCFWEAGLKHGNFCSHPQSQLPKDVFDALENCTRGASQGLAKRYPTAEAAAAALEAAEKKVAGGVVTAATPAVEKNYTPYRLCGVWCWISEKNPGTWGAEFKSAHLPPSLFSRLTRASRCVTERGNCWAGYDSEKEALDGLADAKTLVALDNNLAAVKPDAPAKVEDKPAEPAYEPLPYPGYPGKFFWIEAGNVARGWPTGPALDKAILPDALFAALRTASTGATPMSVTRYTGNCHNGYVTREAAMEDLANARKVIADREKARADAVARLTSFVTPSRGANFGRVEALRSSVIDEDYEVLSTDPKNDEVVLRCVTTQTLVVSTAMLAANFVPKASWKLEANCDKDGRPVT
jgi:hypothetical protein